MSGDRYKELKNNTLILAISNIGSKAMTFILAPIYTYYLIAADYGSSDLIVTTIGLLAPLFCLDIYEATFRFSNDEKFNPQKVLYNSLIICLPGICIALVVSALSIYLGKEIVAVVALGTLLTELNAIMAQYLRGIKKVKQFAISGITNALVLFFSSVYFIVYLRKGLYGWILSYFLGLLFTLFYLVINTKAFSIIKSSFFSIEYVVRFVSFCLPLIPTASMWWIMNMSDRYLITLFLGVSWTGIYSASAKIPAILSVFERVFYQAWQTMSIDTYNDEVSESKVYSDVFNNYITVLSAGTLGLIAIGKTFVLLMYDASYHEAWSCLAFLVVSVMIHALTGNLGALYSTFKRTKGALYSSMTGAMINILLNIVFIPLFGIVGAAVATLLGYLATLIYRVFDIRKFVEIKYDKRSIAFSALVISVQLALYYIDGILAMLFRYILFFMVVLFNRRLFYRILRK